MLALQHLSLLTPPVLSCDYTSGTGICAHHPAGSSGCLIPLPVTQLLGECHLTATRTADSLAAGPHRPYEALTIFHKTPIALPTYSAYCRKGLAVGNGTPTLGRGVLGAGATPAASRHPSAAAHGAAPRRTVPSAGGDGSTTPRSHEHDRLTAAGDNLNAVCLLLKGMFFMADLISGE